MAEALLDVRNVCRVFTGPGGEAVNVLSGLSLTLEAGASVAVVGPSGSGKSTLLNIIGGLDRPSSGEVRVAGRDLGTLSSRDLARYRNAQVGFVFQLHHLLPQCTALENVLIPTLVPGAPVPTGEAETRARALLERVGLGRRMAAVPGQLSGGERQRVAVVRALINEPRLLLADEPTGSLDRRSAATLAELLVELNREEGVALVLVTHDEELAARADRTLELRDGSLIAATDDEEDGR